MEITVRPVDREVIRGIRQERFSNLSFQFRYYACYDRNWCDGYGIFEANDLIGYGLVKGKDNFRDRDSIFEYHLKTQSGQSLTIFKKLIAISHAKYIECQTNDLVLSGLMRQLTQLIQPESILFQFDDPTNFAFADVLFRERSDSDQVFEHEHEPIGEYVLEHENMVVATGGFYAHYNPPFVDLFMEVHPGFRNRGYGSFLLQEVIKICRQQGKTPAARCAVTNMASQKTLLKAGLVKVGEVQVGEIV